MQPGFGRSEERTGDTMKNHLRIIQIFALAMLADGAAVQAQGTGRFNRVTTASVQRNASYSSARVTVAVRSGGNRGVEGSSFRADSLHPYSSQALAQTQSATAGVPRHSTSAEPTVATPQPAPSAPRTYFPGLRPARVIQQPVRLTARATGAGHICTPSRSQMMGGGHHR